VQQEEQIILFFLGDLCGGCSCSSLPRASDQQLLHTGLSSIVFGPVSGDSIRIVSPYLEHFSYAGSSFRSFFTLSVL
jgi:hypothetical protein